jgi:hypothetical protein
MKNLLIIFTILLTFSSYVQVDKYSGIYQEKSKRPTGEILEVVMELKSDGTFYCTFYQDQLDYKDNDKGKGKWTVKNGEIEFSAVKEFDINNEYTMDFNGTKAKLEGSTLTFTTSKMIWPPRVPLSKKT